MRRLSHAFCLILPLLGHLGSLEAEAQGSSDSSRTLAARYLKQADSLARKDGGRLWGRSLEGPLMLVDRTSRAIVANMADTEGHLTLSDGVFVGSLPTEQNLANTAFPWGGLRWTMVLLPLPEDPALRGAILMHELWHRMQDSLGFPAASPTNDHLAERDGRVWLRLEGRSVASALRATGAARKQAIADALTFRRYRRSLFPGADTSERALEMNEGLADYTGFTLAGFTGKNGDAALAARMITIDTASSLGRSFAYYTGPAYGRLLDESGVTWRASLTARDDLAERLGRAFRLPKTTPPLGDAEQRAQGYGYGDVVREEDARAVAQVAHRAALKQRFVTGPVLRLPLREMRVAFDPGKVEPLDSSGTVYETLRIVDRWGILDVTEGGGLIRDWVEAVVPAPTAVDSNRAVGPGWTLELAKGWRIEPRPQDGDFIMLETR
jgi:hypothetical protein